MTELIRGLYNVAPRHMGGVVTIGNFDGVHLGHQALLKKVKETAQALKVPSTVITFEPQPLEYFMPNKAVPRLTRWREKFCELAKLGIDNILVLRFNEALANLSADDFIKKILCDTLHVRHIIIGDDFRFGQARAGDFNYLKNAGVQHGFIVEDMPSVIDFGERISSTRIRKALADSDLALAEQLLGRPYTMMGRIVHGDKLGRALGFPTANIYLHRAVTPVQGIYVVRMHGLAKKGLPGVANVGTRPAVGGTRTLLEVYLFNFDQNIYGRDVCVEFCEKLRDEEHYPNLELLKTQIAKDAEQARQYFVERKEL